MSTKCSIIQVVCLLASCFALNVSAEYGTRQFLWEQANTLAASASKPEAYAKVADTYERLVADGVVTAPLLMNLGSAQVLAGDYTKAIASFTRAERYVGTTPEIKQGLLAAFSKQAGQQQTQLPWVRTALFWHYSLPCQMRTWIALGGWLLFWGGLFLRLLVRHHPVHALASLSGTGMFVGGVTTLIFATSVIVTVLLEVT